MEVQLHEFLTRELDGTDVVSRTISLQLRNPPCQVRYEGMWNRSRPEGSGKWTFISFPGFESWPLRPYHSISFLLTAGVHYTALRALYTRNAYVCQNNHCVNWTVCWHLKEAEILHTIMLYGVCSSVKRFSIPCFWRTAKKSVLVFLETWIGGHFWAQ